MSVPSPSWRRWRYLDHPGPIPFAHRGGAAAGPENTRRAFAHAVALGYRYLETDVHVTADGVAVAFHDDVLDRVTDRTGAIAALPWREVRRAKVGGTEEILRLDDLLGSFPRCRVNLDPKHDAAVDALVRVVQRTASRDRVLVGSFRDRRIAEARRRLGPQLAVAAGPALVARLRFGPVPARVEAACVQVPTSVRGVTVVDERFVARCHRLGLAVHVWTVDDPAEMARLLELGVDGLMTDRPVVLRQVLAERGQWHGAEPAGPTD